MVLPTGQISMSQVNTELGLATTTAISLNQANVRTLAGIASGAISMNDLRGKSAAAGLTLVHNVTGSASTMLFPTIQNNDIIFINSRGFIPIPLQTLFGGWNLVTRGTQITIKTSAFQISGSQRAETLGENRFLAGTSALTGQRVAPAAVSGKTLSYSIQLTVFRGLATVPAMTLLGTAVAAAATYSQSINFGGATPCINGLGMSFANPQVLTWPPTVTFGGVAGTPYPASASLQSGASCVLEAFPSVASTKTVAVATGANNTAYRAFVIR
jgi:hypothetical protein